MSEVLHHFLMAAWDWEGKGRGVEDEEGTKIDGVLMAYGMNFEVEEVIVTVFYDFFNVAIYFVLSSRFGVASSCDFSRFVFLVHRFCLICFQNIANKYQEKDGDELLDAAIPS